MLRALGFRSFFTQPRWKPDISAAALVGRAADFLTKRPRVLKGDEVDAPRASACQGPLIQDFVCGDCPASAAPGNFPARIMSASARLHVDEYCGRATLIGIIGEPARSLFQSQVLSETYPTRLMAISMGMTIGGTNQPFIARLRCSDFLVNRNRQFVPVPSASSRATHLRLGICAARPDSLRAAGVGIPPRGRYSTCADAGTLRDVAIRAREELYSDRGMPEIDPVTDVPRANLAPV